MTISMEQEPCDTWQDGHLLHMQRLGEAMKSHVPSVEQLRIRVPRRIYSANIEPRLIVDGGGVVVHITVVGI
jgi:hypothetical protein